MQTQIRKWGNSLGLRIPQALAEDLEIKDGSIVKLSSQNGKLEVAPIYPKKYSLKELLDKITEDNIHGEIKSGSAKGKEIW